MTLSGHAPLPSIVDTHNVLWPMAFLGELSLLYHVATGQASRMCVYNLRPPQSFVSWIQLISQGSSNTSGPIKFLPLEQNIDTGVHSKLLDAREKYSEVCVTVLSSCVVWREQEKTVKQVQRWGRSKGETAAIQWVAFCRGSPAALGSSVAPQFFVTHPPFFS